jgi:hypothetical protein
MQDFVPMVDKANSSRLWYKFDDIAHKVCPTLFFAVWTKWPLPRRPFAMLDESKGIVQGGAIFRVEPFRWGLGHRRPA